MRMSYQFKDASNCHKEFDSLLESDSLLECDSLLVRLDSGSSPGMTKSTVFFPRINKGIVCFFGIECDIH